MMVTLELRPEVEAQLLAQANAKGLSLERYLSSLVESQAAMSANLNSVQAMNYDDWEREFEALIDSFPQQPVLSDEAISRESIYTREDNL